MSWFSWLFDNDRNEYVSGKSEGNSSGGRTEHHMASTNHDKSNHSHFVVNYNKVG